MTDRLCCVCDKPLVRRPLENKADWERRQCCSRKCEALRRRHERVIPPPKICVICGRPFTIAANQSPGHFSRRTVCSAKCGAKKRWKDGPPAPAPEPTPKAPAVRRKRPPADQEEIERRCRENIARYHAQQGKTAVVETVPTPDGYYVTKVTIVEGAAP